MYRSKTTPSGTWTTQTCKAVPSEWKRYRSLLPCNHWRLIPTTTSALHTFFPLPKPLHLASQTALPSLPKALTHAPLLHQIQRDNIQCQLRVTASHLLATFHNQLASGATSPVDSLLHFSHIHTPTSTLLPPDPLSLSHNQPT